MNRPGQGAGRCLAVVLTLPAALGLGASACSRTAVGGGTSVTTVASALSASVDIGVVRGYGRVLVTGDGRSLYLFTADRRAWSACQGSCLTTWPPLLVRGTIKAGRGVDSKLISTFKAHSGLQVAYDGHPLYTFAQDAAAGMATGEDNETYGGEWSLVSPRGQAVTEPRS